MSSNQESILNLYSGGGEDTRSQQSRSNGIEFHYTKKMLSEYIAVDSNVIELGCATGYYGMFFADKCNHYMGVDLSPDNIDIFNSKIIAENKTNVSAVVGDATDLCGFADESFDIVMCLGPMYHLSQEERKKVFAECRRIARTGSIIAFAYINRIGVYAGACVNDNWRHIYPNAKTNQYVFKYNTDDEKPGVFYFTSPEEMECDAKLQGLKILKNCGLDFFFASCAIDTMEEEQFEFYMELADKMNESPSCTGLSNHALMICRKER